MTSLPNYVISVLSLSVEVNSNFVYESHLMHCATNGTVNTLLTYFKAIFLKEL